MRTRPDVITTLNLPGGPVQVDEHGYLIDPECWTTDFAECTAAAEHLELTPLHHEVVGYMRAYLDEHGIAADARFVIGFLAEREGVPKADARRRLFELFPYGYVKQACKIAGMKQPRAWSTG